MYITHVGTLLKLCWPVVTVSIIVLAPVQLSGMVTLAVFCTKLLFSALYFPCETSIRRKFPSLPLGTKAVKRNKFKMRAGAGICWPVSLQAFLWVRGAEKLKYHLQFEISVYVSSSRITLDRFCSGPSDQALWWMPGRSLLLHLKNHCQEITTPGRSNFEIAQWVCSLHLFRALRRHGQSAARQEKPAPATANAAPFVSMIRHSDKRSQRVYLNVKLPQHLWSAWWLHVGINTQMHRGVLHLFLLKGRAFCFFFSFPCVLVPPEILTGFQMSFWWEAGGEFVG